MFRIIQIRCGNFSSYFHTERPMVELIDTFDRLKERTRGFSTTFITETVAYFMQNTNSKTDVFTRSILTENGRNYRPVYTTDVFCVFVEDPLYGKPKGWSIYAALRAKRHAELLSRGHASVNIDGRYFIVSGMFAIDRLNAALKRTDGSPYAAVYTQKDYFYVSGRSVSPLKSRRIEYKDGAFVYER